MSSKVISAFNYDLYFQASKSISNEEEFKYELENYCNTEGKELVIIETGNEPIVEIDGERYICKIGEAFRATKIPMIPVDLISGKFLGYRWVYLYKC